MRNLGSLGKFVKFYYCSNLKPSSDIIKYHKSHYLVISRETVGKAPFDNFVFEQILIFFNIPLLG